MLTIEGLDERRTTIKERIARLTGFSFSSTHDGNYERSRLASETIYRLYFESYQTGLRQLRDIDVFLEVLEMDFKNSRDLVHRVNTESIINYYFNLRKDLCVELREDVRYMNLEIEGILEDGAYTKN